MIDEILARVGLKYDDLEPPERETLNVWLQALQQSQVNPEKLKGYISSMRESVENELTKSDLGTKQDLFLKARLRNYLLLEAFLSSPDKAKEQLDRAIAGLVSSRK